MSFNLRAFSLTSDSSKENSMKNSILNNIQTENTWIDVETLAKLKGVTKRAVRISINKYEYIVEAQRLAVRLDAEPHPRLDTLHVEPRQRGVDRQQR